MVLRLMLCLVLTHCCVGCSQLAVAPNCQPQTILGIEWHGPHDAHPADICVYLDGKPVGYGEEGWQRAFDAMRQLPSKSIVILVYNDPSIFRDVKEVWPPYFGLAMQTEFSDIVKEKKLRVEVGRWIPIW